MSYHFSYLPTEIKLHIMTFLKPSDLKITSQVSSAWNQLSNDSSLWKKLHFNGNQSSEMIGQKLQQYTQVKIVILNQMSFDSWSWTTRLVTCVTLRTLEIYFSTVTAKIIGELVRVFCDLRKIAISRVCKGVDDCVIDEMTNWKLLKQIRIDFCKVKDQSRCLAIIADKCVNLDVLNIENASGINDWSFSKLVELRGDRLKQLGLSCDNITDAGFRSIAKCEKLTHLNLFHAQKISDIGLMVLKELTNLEELLISKSSNVSAKGFVQLFGSSKFLRLYRLSLWNCRQIEDVGLKMISNSCPSLKQLQLCNCKNVSDTALDVVAANFKMLNELIVTGRKLISAHTVENILNKLKSLTYLDIDNVMLSSTGVVENLVCRNPNLTAFCNGVNIKMSRKAALQKIQLEKKRQIYHKIKKKYALKKQSNLNCKKRLNIQTMAKKRKYVQLL